MFTITAQVQEPLPCGTEEPETVRFFDQSELKDAWLRLESSSKKEPRTFMVALHIIRNNNGGGGIKKSFVLAAFDEMNETYANANILFEQCQEVTYIDDNRYLETIPSEVAGLMANNNIDNVINIYFIPQVINGSDEGICGNATFPSTPASQRRILMDNDCVNNGSTLIHEMGHYFGLLHTHSTFNGEEIVARTNCSTAGDQFCDTPADPRLSSATVSNCIYVGGETDVYGDTYTPDPSNFMSYAPKVCRIDFSPQQYAHISLIAATENDYYFETCEVADFQLSSSQSSEVNVSNFEDIEFQLDVSSLNLKDDTELDYLITTKYTNEISPSTLENGTLAFDVDNPKNLISFTIPFSSEFMTLATVTVEIDPDNSIQEPNEENNRIEFNISHDYRVDRGSFVYPNPAANSLQLYLNNKELGDYIVRIYDDIGKLYIEKSATKHTIYDLEDIDVRSITPGMYYIQVDYAKGEREVFKFVKL